MFGAWGKATSNGQVIQLRALDWVKIILYRISMGLIINFLSSLSTTQVAPNMVTLGSILVLWDGSVYCQVLMKTSSQFQRLVSLSLMRLLEKKAALVIHLPSS
jgi:hypothetical protein